MISYMYTGVPSNKSAKAWRQNGNEFFQQRKYEKALDCYTQSVLGATYSSDGAAPCDDLTLAYANRSAALYHLDKYKLSLQDIDLALDHGYPNNILYKLQQRKGLCMLELGKIEEAVEAFTDTLQLIESHVTMDVVKQTSLKAEMETYIDKCLKRNVLRKSSMKESTEGKHFLRSEVIANASSSVCLRYNTIKGRHLVAYSSIQAGSVVIQELPFASVLLPEHHGSHCHFCYMHLIAPVPCNRCSKVLYCSRDCQQSAWKEHHSIECPHWETLQQLGTFAWLSLRMVLAACSKEKDGLQFLHENKHTSQSTESGESVIPGCKVDGMYKAGYRAVCSLMPHTESHTEEELVAYKQKAELLARCLSKSLLQKPNQQQSVNKHQALTCKKLSDLSIKTCQETLVSDDTDQHSKPTNTESPHRHSNESDLTKAFDPVDQDPSSSDRKSEPYRTAQSHNEKSDSTASEPDSVNTSDPMEDNQSNSATMEILIKRFIFHMQQLKCNAHAVTAVKTIQPDGSGDQRSNSGKVVSTEQVRLATAVYATTSLMNHSCEPNVIASFQGRHLTIRAIKDIEEHEEILHCYGPHAKHMDTLQRHKTLQEQYFFTCQCIACERDSTKPAKKTDCDWSRAFQCPQCKEPISRSGRNPVSTLRCKKCEQEVNFDVLEKHEWRASQLFSQAMVYLHNDDTERCLSILQQCYDIRTRVLYKHHRDLAETQDCIARCYASIGNLHKAGEYLKASVATIGRIYGEDSIELANELHKLAQVYFNGREVQKAKDVINQALRLFTMHYGGNHESLDELKQMHMCLIQEGMT